MIRYKSMDEVKKAFPLIQFPKPVRIPSIRKQIGRSPIKRSKTPINAIASANKKDSPRYQRRKLEMDVLKLWSVKVRERDDNTCQWCTSKNRIQGHHIVARSIANRLGWFEISNGVALCMKCHIFRLKSDPDAYIEWRDRWLAQRGMTYPALRSKFQHRVKVSVSDLLIMKIAMQQNQKATDNG